MLGVRGRAPGGGVVKPLPPALQAAWDAAEANPGTPVDVGRAVVCEGPCGDDYTDSTDTGGCIVGTYAYCPTCTAGGMADAIAADRREHPGAVIDPSPLESFADFVRRIRAETGTNHVRVTHHIRSHR